jgi:hypothetical protein
MSVEEAMRVKRGEVEQTGMSFVEMDASEEA